MGWRERDWAKFTDAERHALYGGGGSSYVPPPAPLTPTEHGNRLRAVIWSAVAAAVLGVGGFAYTQRQPGRAVLPPPPAVVFGTAMSPTVVCENEILESRQWRCLDMRTVEDGTRVVTPPPAADGCVHVIADQARGTWTCVSLAPSF